MGISVDFVDAVHSHTWSVELSDQDEIFLNEVWYKEDQLLVGLSHQEPFKNRTTWSDLEMVHYQILLMKAFDLLGENHPMDDITVRFREPFATFRFLATGIVKMSKLNGVDGFDNLTISRPREARIVVDFRRIYRFDWDSYVPPAPKPKIVNPFQIVVDNTK